MLALPFLFLLMFLAVLAQVWAGSYGFFLPAAGYAVFYITAVYGWRGGIVTAIVMGSGVDAVYMRH
ncbi:MAG: hypothetical protein PHQ27_08950, partial [Victivallales bacterium]|nr:hypothetical protein [Victivallales bacterium]